MADHAVAHLAIVDEDGMYLGLIELEDLLDSDVELISELEESFETWRVGPEARLADVLEIFRQHELTAVAIVSLEGKYESIVSSHDFIRHFANLSGSGNPASSMIISLEARDYAMSQIAKIAENNDAQILSAYLMNSEEGSQVLLYLHFNISDLSRLIAAYERFGYSIIHVHHHSQHTDLLEERYAALMSYLNV